MIRPQYAWTFGSQLLGHPVHISFHFCQLCIFDYSTWSNWFAMIGSLLTSWLRLTWIQWSINLVGVYYLRLLVKLLCTSSPVSNCYLLKLKIGAFLSRNVCTMSNWRKFLWRATMHGLKTCWYKWTRFVSKGQSNTTYMYSISNTNTMQVSANMRMWIVTLLLRMVITFIIIITTNGHYYYY